MIKVISFHFNCCLFCEHSLRLSVAGPRYEVLLLYLVEVHRVLAAPVHGWAHASHCPPVDCSPPYSSYLAGSSSSDCRRRIVIIVSPACCLPGGSTAPLFPGYRRIHKSTLFLSPSYWPHRAIRCRLNTFQSMYVYHY